MKSRKYGRIRISRKFIVDAPATVQRIMGMGIVVRAEHMFVNDVIEYVMWSEEFDVIPDGHIIPEYEVLITRTSFRHTIRFKRQS